ISRNERDLLQMAASLENQSEHPLARAIVAAANKEQIELREATGFESTTGGGVAAKLDGKLVRVGKEKFLSDARATIPDELKNQARTLHDKAQTTVWVAIRSEERRV